MINQGKFIGRIISMEPLKFDYFDDYQPKIDAIFMIDDSLNILRVRRNKRKNTKNHANYMMIQFAGDICEKVIKLHLLDRYVYIEGYFKNTCKRKKEMNIFVVNELVILSFAT